MNISPERSISIPTSIASMLDLGTAATDMMSTDQLLNALLLSIMGKLRITRGCILRRSGQGFDAMHVKGLPTFSVPTFELSEPVVVGEVRNVLPELPEQVGTLVPIHELHELVAVLCLGEPMGGRGLSIENMAYLQLASILCSTAIGNQAVVRSLVDAKKNLESRNLMITTLFEAVRDFTGRTEADDIVRVLSYRLMGQLMVSGFILLLRSSDGTWRSTSRGGGITGISGIERDLLAVVDSTCSDDPDLTPELRRELSSRRIGLVSPMLVRGDHRGVLILSDKLTGKEFSDEDVELVEALGSTAMAALDAHRLMQVEVERSAMMKQIEIAIEMQRGLLPLELPSVHGLDIAASMTPSLHVGGDYYDVIPLPNGKTLFAVADVAGKGIAASLLMSNVQASLNTLADMDLPLADVVSRINNLICMNTKVEDFVTFFTCIIDSSTFEIEYVNAGHNPPILSSSDVRHLTVGGVLAGVFLNHRGYSTGYDRMDAGNVLVLYTDGVTEARSKDGEEYGSERLEQCIRSLQSLSAEHILSGIRTRLVEFTQSDRFDDDTTLIVIKRT